MSQWKDSDLWIEFLEGELDEAHQQDLAVLLSNSEDEEDTLKQYQALRKHLEKTDTVEIPEDEIYHKKLHDKIMAEVDQTHVDSPVWAKMYKGRAVGFAAAASIILVAAISLWMAVQDQIRTGIEGPQLAFVSSQLDLLERSAKNPESLAETVITYEDNNEFLMDSAARRLNGLSDADASRAMESLME